MSSPTLEEAYRLQDHNYYNVVSAVAISLAYGIYISTFTETWSILYPKYRPFKARHILFPLIIFLFFSSTLFYATMLAFHLLPQNWHRVTSSDISFQERLKQLSALKKVPLRISYIAAQLTFLVADGILVWRAYIICSFSRWQRVVLVLLLGGNAVAAICAAVLDFIYWNYEGSGGLITAKVDTAFLFISLGVNVVATSFIAIQGRKFSKMLNDVQVRHNRSPLVVWLWLLTEAGLIFCLLQVTNAALSLTLSRARISGRRSSIPRAVSLATAVIWHFSVLYAAIYPNIVVNLIDKKRSVLEQSVQSNRTSTFSLPTSFPSTPEGSGTHREIIAENWSKPDHNQDIALGGVTFAPLRGYFVDS